MKKVGCARIGLAALIVALFSLTACSNVSSSRTDAGPPQAAYGATDAGATTALPAATAPVAKTTPGEIGQGTLGAYVKGTPPTTAGAATAPWYFTDSNETVPWLWVHAFYDRDWPVWGKTAYWIGPGH